MDAAMELPSLELVWGFRFWRREVKAGRLAGFSGEFKDPEGNVHRFKIETVDDIKDVPVARGSPPKIAVRCNGNFQEIDSAKKFVLTTVKKDARGRKVFLLPIKG